MDSGDEVTDLDFQDAMKRTGSPFDQGNRMGQSADLNVQQIRYRKAKQQYKTRPCAQ